MLPFVVGYKHFTAIVYWEDDIYVADCPEVELAKTKQLKKRSHVLLNNPK